MYEKKEIAFITETKTMTNNVLSRIPTIYTTLDNNKWTIH